MLFNLRVINDNRFLTTIVFSSEKVTVAEKTKTVRKASTFGNFPILAYPLINHWEMARNIIYHRP